SRRALRSALFPYTTLFRSGMGRVYKAVHKTLNRVVALKMLSPELVRTPRARTLFKREVQAAGQLSHPHIVTAYDANKIDGRHFRSEEHTSELQSRGHLVCR